MKDKIRAIVFDKYNGKCAYCGVDLMKGWNVDHIKPQVFGGTNDLDNLNSSCKVPQLPEGGVLETNVNNTTKTQHDAKLHIMRSLPKQKLSKKQMKAIREILQDAFEQGLRQSDYAWLLDADPTQWSSHQSYKTEQDFWDLAEAVSRIAGDNIEKLMCADGNAA